MKNKENHKKQDLVIVKLTLNWLRGRLVTFGGFQMASKME